MYEVENNFHVKTWGNIDVVLTEFPFHIDLYSSNVPYVKPKKEIHIIIYEYHSICFFMVPRNKSVYVFHGLLLLIFRIFIHLQAGYFLHVQNDYQLFSREKIIPARFRYTIKVKKQGYFTPFLCTQLTRHQKLRVP